VLNAGYRDWEEACSESMNSSITPWMSCHFEDHESMTF
jgi:hypothetical protein